MIVPFIKPWMRSLCFLVSISFLYDFINFPFISVRFSPFQLPQLHQFTHYIFFIHFTITFLLLFLSYHYLLLSHIWLYFPFFLLSFWFHHHVPTMTLYNEVRGRRLTFLNVLRMIDWSSWWGYILTNSILRRKIGVRTNILSNNDGFSSYLNIRLMFDSMHRLRMKLCEWRIYWLLLHEMSWFWSE